MTQYISTPYRNRAKDLIFNGILNEIKDLKDIPDQHKFYLFLLFNDQQRHLFTHFETIGTHKIELVLPYFDSDFLSLILTLPTKQCLEHEFYMQWFNHFPDFVRKTPWQTYPGHKACPSGDPPALQSRGILHGRIHRSVRFSDYPDAFFNFIFCNNSPFNCST